MKRNTGVSVAELDHRISHTVFLGMPHFFLTQIPDPSFPLSSPHPTWIMFLLGIPKAPRAYLHLTLNPTLIATANILVSPPGDWEFLEQSAPSNTVAPAPSTVRAQ